MQSLFKNKLIILLLCAIVAVLAIRQDKQQALPISVKQQPKTVNKGEPINSVINPNPEQRSALKNPFKILTPGIALPMTAKNNSISLMGTVAQNSEFMVILSVHGKSDFYRLNQKVLEYTVQEINSTSVVLYNEQTKQRSILHIKE